MSVHSSSCVSFPVSVLSVKSWMSIYFYMLMWTSCFNTSVTGQHQVIGSQPVRAKEGDDVILPCHIEPSVNMEKKTVEWTRPDVQPEQKVHVHQDGHPRPNNSHSSYKHRTFLFEERLSDGNMSLELHRVRLSDNGTYQCSAPNLNSSSEISNSDEIQLLVGSVSTPVISSKGPNVTCESGCWYPQPEMSWLDSKGNNIPSVPPKVTSVPPCFFVQTKVKVERGANVTCRVHLRHINHTVDTDYSVPERDKSTEKGATGAVIAGIFILILILVALELGYLYYEKVKSDRSHTSDPEGATSNKKRCACVNCDRCLDLLMSIAEKACSESLPLFCDRCIGGGLFCAFLGTVLLVIAMANDYWFHYKLGHADEREWDSYNYQGLWREQNCEGTAPCITKNLYEILGITKNLYEILANARLAMGIFLIVMGLLCVFGIITGIKSYVLKSKPSRSAWKIFFSSSGVVALNMFIYTIVTVIANWKLGKKWGFAWAYWLCWVSSAMTFSAGILTCWACRQHSSLQTTPQQHSSGTPPAETPPHSSEVDSHTATASV